MARVHLQLSLNNTNNTRLSANKRMYVGSPCLTPPLNQTLPVSPTLIPTFMKQLVFVVFLWFLLKITAALGCLSGKDEQQSHEADGEEGK